VLHVTEVEEVTEEVIDAIAALLPQLSASAPPPRAAEIEAIVASASTVLFVARTDDGRVVGTLTLAVFRIPTGIRAWIEDVVVDGSVRGQGGGEALTVAALAAARAAGARTVELTSRPSREAANRLYLRLGFITRQTNLYRFDL